MTSQNNITQDLRDREAILIPDREAIEVLRSWLTNPYPRVGMSSGGLGMVPRSLDHAGKAGCRSQSYTSWDCLSRCYITSYGRITPNRMASALNHAKYVPVEEISKTQKMTMTTIMAAMVLDKKLVHIPTIGVVDPIALTDPRYKDILKKFIFVNRNIPTGDSLDDYLKNMDDLASAQRIRNHLEVIYHDGIDNNTKQDKDANDKPIYTVVDGKASKTKRVLNEDEEDYLDYRRLSAIASSKASTSKASDFVLGAVVPIRYVVPSSWLIDGESEDIPFTPMYNGMLSKLSDPTAGTLGSVIRGTTVRDSTSVLGLVEHLANQSGTVLEVAALVRIGCMVLSVDVDGYDDVVTKRFMRFKGTTHNYTENISLSSSIRVGGKLICMPLDIFMAFTKGKFGDADDSGEFEPSGIDAQWAVIPVRTEMAGDAALMMYVMSFLSSEYWAGSVSLADMSFYHAPDDITKDEEFETRMMPCINSVHIPGPTSAILVLVDVTSNNLLADNIKIGQFKVPTFNGRQQIKEADLFDIPTVWKLMWNGTSIQAIKSRGMRAREEIIRNLSVGNAVGLSMSILSELYGSWNHGLYVWPNNVYGYKWPYKPNDNLMVSGAWSFSDQVKKSDNDDTLPYSNINSTSTGNQIEPSYRISGYGISSFSPLHRLPHGVKTLIRDSDNIVRWETQRVTNIGVGYNCKTCNGLTRLAIFTGLVTRSSDLIHFDDSDGFQQWLHMFALTISGITSSLFVNSNLSLMAWTGNASNNADTMITTVYRDIVKYATAGIVGNYDWSSVMVTYNNYSNVMISYYYGFNTDDSRFFSYSPVPFHLTRQYLLTCNFSTGSRPNVLSSFSNSLTSNRMGIALLPEHWGNRDLAVCTIDFLRYRPLVVSQSETGSLFSRGTWIEMWNWLTSHKLPNVATQELKFFESETFIDSPLNSTISYMPVKDMYVVDSAGVYEDLYGRVTKISLLSIPRLIKNEDVIKSAISERNVAPGFREGYTTGGIGWRNVGKDGGSITAQSPKSLMIEEKDHHQVETESGARERFDHVPAM